MAGENGEQPQKPRSVEERLDALEKAFARFQRESEGNWTVEAGFDARMERLMADHREWLHQHDLAIIRARRADKALRKQLRDNDERLGQRIREVDERLGKRIDDLVSSIGALIRKMEERTTPR